MSKVSAVFNKIKFLFFIVALLFFVTGVSLAEAAAVQTATPTINYPVYSGATSVNGTAEEGAQVSLNVNNGTPIKTTATDTTWTVTVPALKDGDYISVVALGTDEMVSDARTTTAGTEKTVVLSSITITTPPTKLSYIVGDTLDLTGLVVTGTNSDGTTQVETIAPTDVTGFDSSVANPTETLTVTYGGKTATYTVSVVDSIPAPTSPEPTPDVTPAPDTTSIIPDATPTTP